MGQAFSSSSTVRFRERDVELQDLLRELHVEQEDRHLDESGVRALRATKALLEEGNLQQSPSCAICFADFVNGESLSRLPGCAHLFHADCIQGWAARASTCPLCRGDFHEAAREAMAARCGAEELEQAGLTARLLRSKGANIPELRGLGFSTRKLREAGFTLMELKQALEAEARKERSRDGRPSDPLGSVPRRVAEDLRQAGFGAHELHFYNSATLRAAGFSVSQLRASGICVVELKKIGVTMQELTDAGCRLWHLQVAGWSYAQLTAAGYSDAELREAAHEAEKKGDKERVNRAPLW